MSSCTALGQIQESHSPKFPRSFFKKKLRKISISTINFIKDPPSQTQTIHYATYTIVWPIERVILYADFETGKPVFPSFHTPSSPFLSKKKNNEGKEPSTMYYYKYIFMCMSTRTSFSKLVKTW